jgi:hypothetical protein
MRKVFFVCGLIYLLGLSNAAPAQTPQHSVARQWNEALLEAIRDDFARPTVHARNLFHTSIAFYDAWAAYDQAYQPFLLGQSVGGFNCGFTGLAIPADPQEAISYAAYRLLTHRFVDSPGAAESQARFDQLMNELGYDAAFTSVDYASGSAAALGNYIGQCLIDFGLQDGSNEENGYANQYYLPFNEPMAPAIPGNPSALDSNFWQPLSFELFIDQSGNSIPGNGPPFLGPEWGRVVPFALTADQRTVYQRDGFDYYVYHDPGPPPHVDTQTPGSLARHRNRSSLRLLTEEYLWGFALVSVWSAHLDPSDQVLWDISPGAIGNQPDLPQTIEAYRTFYNLFDGGDPSQGRPLNPHTGQPYPPQIVPRADYARVLAEFWADGPDSETPPGHWFTILNYVNDHPLLEKRFRGEGPIVDDLAWDVKAYFILAGAMHDAAVCAWGIKGWYDYIRPISAIRSMADRGQSTDPDLPRYHSAGIPLIDGYIELVEASDPLAGSLNEHLGKIKLYAWRGPNFINDPATDLAGVGWILAENWWPYQRPTFVTPPFAGYTSGHSTFSRAAAEVLTLLTGNEYFPGGVGEFHAKKNEFLVFEEGPSVDVTLQWATYRDASDQTSLSRIWGGIHPPADDIPGRLIGLQIGIDAFLHAEEYFADPSTAVVETHTDEQPAAFTLEQNYPNPFNNSTVIHFVLPQQQKVDLAVYNLAGQRLATLTTGVHAAGVHTLHWDGRDHANRALASGLYLYRLDAGQYTTTRKLLLLR